MAPIWKCDRCGLIVDVGVHVEHLGPDDDWLHLANRGNGFDVRNGGTPVAIGGSIELCAPCGEDFATFLGGAVVDITSSVARQS
jgi:hypothetical protein